LEPTKHLEDRGHVAEGEVAGAIRLARPCLGQSSDDLLCRAQIALRDDPGLALHPSGLGQVVVGLPVLLLPDDECRMEVLPYVATKRESLNRTNALVSGLSGRTFSRHRGSPQRDSPETPASASSSRPRLCRMIPISFRRPARSRPNRGLAAANRR